MQFIPTKESKRHLIGRNVAEIGGYMWQPIETAPLDGQTILLYRHISSWHVIGYGHWVTDDEPSMCGWLSYGFDDPPGNLGLGAPTHWMPIPEPPND